MRKIILTEGQVKNLLSSVINEQGNDNNCVTATLYEILNKNTEIQFPKERAVFKVTNIYGMGVKLNGKPVQDGSDGYIINARTSITMCFNDQIMLSGMNLPESSLQFGERGIDFIPQMA